MPGRKSPLVGLKKNEKEGTIVPTKEILTVVDII
jgi:hypothetical protein